MLTMEFEFRIMENWFDDFFFYKFFHNFCSNIRQIEFFHDLYLVCKTRYFFWNSPMDFWTILRWSKDRISLGMFNLTDEICWIKLGWIGTTIGTPLSFLAGGIKLNVFWLFEVSSDTWNCKQIIENVNK